MVVYNLDKVSTGDPAQVEEQVAFCCPHCLQHSAVTIDLAARHQQFVEDCQVCCEPISFDIDVRNGEVVRMDYEPVN